MKNPLPGLAVLVLGASLAACGGGGDGPTTGQINLKLTDAPVDGAKAVILVFTGVELQPAGGQRIDIDFPSERAIDLMAFQNGATVDLLRGEEVPAGDYNWMRLKVVAQKNLQNGSRIEFPDATYPLYIPSGAESGLKLNRAFSIAAGGVTRLVADFDLRKSIIAPPGQDPNYVLKPVLRLMDELETGTLTGTVNLRALTDAQLGAEPVKPIGDCQAGVYVFEQTTAGSPATPDDMDRDLAGDDDGGGDPVVYFPVAWDGVNDSTTFGVEFLATGRYTVSATCDYDVDASPDANEYRPNAAAGADGYQTMRWTSFADVAIAAGQATDVTVPAP